MNRLNFVINRRCQPIRRGNPKVDINLFYNKGSLHILNLSRPELNVTEINSNQTFGGDWLLETTVANNISRDPEWASLPTPYDNNYRGGDPKNNPDLRALRFDPDKPVFVLLTDRLHTLYDPCLVLRENTLENPSTDGGG